MAAEIERGLISARTKEALRARRASGLPVGRPTERPRQKQAGQAPSGNRGDARQRVHPKVHREALQFFACQPHKLAEEARSQETEAVKSYGGFCTFEPLGLGLVLSTATYPPAFIARWRKGTSPHSNELNAERRSKVAKANQDQR